MSRNQEILPSLPLWAQRKISVLEGLLRDSRKDFEKRMDEVAGITPTPIKIDVANDMDRFIPVDSIIDFVLYEGGILRVSFNDDRTGVKIHKIKAGGGCDASIYVKPKCSNLIEAL